MAENKNNRKPEMINEPAAEEKKHLEKVLGVLEGAMRDITTQKKNLSEHLVEYRKQIIEEQRFDEDKPLDAFDHEMFAREEAYKAALRKTSEIMDLIESPYFGKVTFTEDGNTEDIYIGKYGFMDEKNYDPLIIDWRAPVSSLFYHGGLGKAYYKAPSGKTEADIKNRRQFIIKQSQLLGMFDTETEIRDEILQYVLSSSASEKLKDIIMTIQKEQDEIIRYDRKGTVLVNGRAGSGKTTIALHRIAYLIYNYRKELENRVLILGPNNIFMEYISTVLPTLGETSVRQNTVFDFVTELLGNIPDVLPQEDYVKAVNQGDTELLHDGETKRSRAYLDSLERYAESLTLTLYPPKDIYFAGELLMSEDEMRNALEKDFSTMEIIKRGMRLKRVLIARMKDIRNRKLREINKRYRDTEKNVLEGTAGEDTFMPRRDAIRQLIGEVIEFRDEVRYLGKGSVPELYMRQNTMRILTRQDLIPMLYLKMKLEGIKLPYSIRYLVIDEAQDLSAANITVLSELTGNPDMTIVGDVNQRLIPFSDDEGYLKINKFLKDVKEFTLNRSYRSTDEIVKYSGTMTGDTLGSSLREGEEVRVMDITPSELAGKVLEEYGRMKDKGMESVAIITRNSDFAEELSPLIKNTINHRFIKDEDGVYNSKTLLLSTYLAKGLEFDGVIIADSEPDTEKPDLIKYIMATRALHMLSVLNIRE